MAENSTGNLENRPQFDGHWTRHFSADRGARLLESQFSFPAVSASTCRRPEWLPLQLEGAQLHSPWTSRCLGLLEGKGFLIHQGPDDDAKTAGGSLGCIEVVGKDEWDDFLGLLESITGADCQRIGAQRALTVRIEHAEFPTATVV